MKAIYLSLLVLMFTACGQPTEETGIKSAVAAADYSQLDKFLGSWSAEGQPTEVITIKKCNNFDSAKICLVNDGKTEIAFPYNVKEDKLRLHQPEYWVEILHDNATGQLNWKVIHFDETDGKVVRKYVPKK